MGLEGLNGTLGSIAMMYVWRDELVPNLPLVYNGGLEFGADVVVKDLEINFVTKVGEVAHDGVIGSQSVFVRPVNSLTAKSILVGEKLVATYSISM